MVLDLYMFLKKKWDGKIKLKTVSRGNKNRKYIPKEDAISPTIITEYVLLTSIIYAEKNRDVSVIDIPDAFIKTRVEDKNYTVIINLRGALVDILCKISSH